MRTIVALAAVLGLTAPALGQDGGKIPWNKDPQAAIAQAKKTGKPMMMFFTSEG
jgi:hypothetical protein